jgi:hypothetical protein
MTLYFGAGAAEPWVLAAGAMTGAFAGVALLITLSGAAGGLRTCTLVGGSLRFTFAMLKYSGANRPRPQRRPPV